MTARGPIPGIVGLLFCGFRSCSDVTRDMLAYCRLIIREALRHGGNGWQEYDRTFRRQAAIDPHLPWHTLHPGLQAATVLSNRGTSGGTICIICREPDHSVLCSESSSHCFLQHHPAVSFGVFEGSTWFALRGIGEIVRSQGHASTDISALHVGGTTSL